MEISKYSNKGCRQENQDFIAYKVLSQASAIFVITDGMGGYSKGDVAAKIVAESIVDYVESNIDKIPPTPLLKEAVTFSNDSLMLKRLALGTQKMGCVVAALLLVGADAFMTWLGDSRIYLYRNNHEAYHTEDHSVINELSKIKTLSADCYQKYASIVTRSVMGDDKLGNVEVSHTITEAGDIFVLCTDGLHKEFSVERIVKRDVDLQDFFDKKASNFSDNFSFIKVIL